MIDPATPSRNRHVPLRPWMLIVFLVLVLGVGYIVLRDEPATDAPVPSPNFKSEEELGP